MRRLTFTDAGLTYWLVSDAVGHLASQYGLSEEAERLYQFPVPRGRRSPAGAPVLARRVFDTVRAASVVRQRELHRLGAPPRWEWGPVPLPYDLRVPMDMAISSELWAGSTKIAKLTVLEALKDQLHRDQLDQVMGRPLEGSGWASALLSSLRRRQRSHAREWMHGAAREGQVVLALRGEGVWLGASGSEAQAGGAAPSSR